MHNTMNGGVSAFTFRAGAGLVLGPPILATSRDLLGILSYVVRERCVKTSDGKCIARDLNFEEARSMCELLGGNSNMAYCFYFKTRAIMYIWLDR